MAINVLSAKIHGDAEIPWFKSYGLVVLTILALSLPSVVPRRRTPFASQEEGDRVPINWKFPFRSVARVINTWSPGVACPRHCACPATDQRSELFGQAGALADDAAICQLFQEHRCDHGTIGRGEIGIGRRGGEPHKRVVKTAPSKAMKTMRFSCREWAPETSPFGHLCADQASTSSTRSQGEHRRTASV